MHKPIVTLVSFALLAFATTLQAQDLRKEKFNLGPWEHEIGYTQAVRVGNTLYLSGSVGEGAMPQAVDQAFGAIQKTLAHYGLDFRHVVKENAFTTDIEALKAANEVRKKYYGTDFPAATWVQISRLFSPQHVLEVEVTAVFPPGGPAQPTRLGPDAPAVADLLHQTLTALYLTGDETVIARSLHDSYAVLLAEAERVQTFTKPMILEGLRRDKAAGKFPTFPGGAFTIDHVETVGDAALARVRFFQDGVHTCSDFISLYRFPDGWKCVALTTHHHAPLRRS